ncbi:O-succinylbenzoic acid--CoA ligase [Glaciihabitans tibetensis]|uniref:O-succinylbenzoic acid--CoA ligase n=1 Tax=Glaciihabitans tibetensis TaxID=1266600 RepID=A0A2T0VA18_9MICO|nr:AMP-binding protein [Glaciihabitans tibetensis]PRY67036.1 O-succinylbenzoic acid--CoA ligase [Glaciihabitans tibetensis]
MTRELLRLPAEPETVFAALRDALSGSGPAVLPVPLAGAVASADAPRVARRVALVVETSGSTGRPKRVALSADALLASATFSDSVLGGAGQWLLALPVHYIAGLNVLVRSIASDTSPVVLAAGPFDPLQFATAAETMDAPLRFVSLVPAQLTRLLDTPEALGVLRRFDRVLVGGQSTPGPVLQRAADLGISLTRTYGSSETGGGCVYDGVPIGNTEVRVIDGQIELSGRVLAEGYLDENFESDDERSAAAFITEHGQRWYRTGDGGEVVDGTLTVTGRLDDVIISGGLKVSLAAIEQAIRALPGQSAAVVVAAPSDRWGEVPVVVTTADVPLDELRERMSRLLGPAAAPDRVVVVGQLPELSSGKPDRRAIHRLAQ